MRLDGRKAFTLVEILISACLLSIIMVWIGSMFMDTTRKFNRGLWESQTTNRMDLTLQKLQKLLSGANYPVNNTFEGVVRDKKDDYKLQFKSGSLGEGNAYSVATESLTSNDVNVDKWSTEYIGYFGSGMKDSLDEDDCSDRLGDSNEKEEILEWVSCKSGYNNMPGFTNRPVRCGHHLLYLANRQKVYRAGEGTYKFYQDLILDTKYSVSGMFSNQNYAAGSALYSPSWSGTSSNALSDEEKNFVGRKLLLPNVATVTGKIYRKGNNRTPMVELDIIAVAPNIGTGVIRKSTKVAIGVEALH